MTLLMGLSLLISGELTFVMIKNIVHKNIYIYTSIKKVREISLDLKVQFDYYARHVE
jgi:hypothetical protein